MDSPDKSQWRGALMFSLVRAWTNGWANTRDAMALIVSHCNDMAMNKLWSIQQILFCKRMMYRIIHQILTSLSISQVESGIILRKEDLIKDLQLSKTWWRTQLERRRRSATSPSLVISHNSCHTKISCNTLNHTPNISTSCLISDLTQELCECGRGKTSVRPVNGMLSSNHWKPNKKNISYLILSSSALECWWIPCTQIYPVEKNSVASWCTC